jgi:hypothetical protein
MLEVAYAQYISETAASSGPSTPCPIDSRSPPINGGAQGSGAGGDDVVIEMSAMPSIVATGENIDAESKGWL